MHSYKLHPILTRITEQKKMIIHCLFIHLSTMTVYFNQKNI